MKRSWDEPHVDRRQQTPPVVARMKRGNSVAQSPRTPTGRFLQARQGTPHYTPSRQGHTPSRLGYTTARQKTPLVQAHQEPVERTYCDYDPEWPINHKGLPAGTVLVRDEHHQVVIQGPVPDQVRSILESVDLHDSDNVRVRVDPVTGFAGVATRQLVYVWNYSHASTTHSPTCYTFPTLTPAPYIEFIPSQTPHIREPGLLIIDSSYEPDEAENTSSGTVTYYENISLALKASQAIHGRLGLGPHEHAISCYRVDSTLVLVSTSTSRVLRLVISSNDGNPVIPLPMPLVKPNHTWLSRSTDVLFPSPRQIVGVSMGNETLDPGLALSSSMAFSNPLGLGSSMFKSSSSSQHATLSGIGIKRECWILSTDSVSGWSLSDHDARFLKQFSILDEIVGRLEPFSQVELRDIAALENGTLLILVSYAPTSESLERSYAVAKIDPSRSVGETLTRLVHLDRGHATTDASMAHLVVPQKSTVAYVITLVGVTTLSLESMDLIDLDAEDQPWQETTLFKGEPPNPILGIGFDRSSLQKPKSSIMSNLITLLPKTGLVGFHTDVSLMPTFASPISLVRQIEQAVFFQGDANPLAFALSVDNAAECEKAIVGVSDLLVDARATYLKPRATQTASLAARQIHLRRLISLVRSVGLIDELRPCMRKRLHEDAVVVSVGQVVWDILSGNEEAREAVIDVMRRQQQQDCDKNDDATLQDFFEHHLREMPLVLDTLVCPLIKTYNELLHKDTRKKLTKLEDLDRLTDSFLAVGQVFAAIMDQGVVAHRQEAMEIYEVDFQHDSKEDDETRPGWLLDPTTRGHVEWVYNHLCSLVDQRTRMLGTVINEQPIQESADGDESTIESQVKQSELRDMAGMLLVPLLYSYEERARLGSLGIQSDSTTTQTASLEQGAAALAIKDELIKSSHEAIVRMITIDVDLAWRSAELFERHATLVDLATRRDLSTSSGDGETQDDRIHRYLAGQYGRPHIPHHEHGYRFAQALFTHYLARSEERLILKHLETYPHAVADFIRRNERYDLAWVQAVGEQRLHDDDHDDDHVGGRAVKAAEAQAKKIERGGQVSVAAIWWSLAKLGQVAQEEHGRARNESNGHVKDLDSHLVYLTALHGLKQRLESDCPGFSTIPPNDKTGLASRTVDSFMSTHVTRMENLPIQAVVYRELVQRVLRGMMINIEAAIEVLTGRDLKRDDDVAGVVQALKWIRDGRVGGAQAVLTGIWRRIYLADDWSTLTDSHKSDRAKTEWMGQTVLYRVLVSMRRSGLSSAYLVSPHGSLVTSPPPAWITRSLKEWGVEFTMDDFEDEDGDEVQGVKRAMDQGLSEMVVSELTARAVEAG